MENVRRILEEVIMARMENFSKILRKENLIIYIFGVFLFVTIILEDSIINVLIQCVVIRN